MSMAAVALSYLIEGLDMKVLVDRPMLDLHDFNTVRQLYSESQQWARHYEGMIVNANVLIISASLVFVGLAFNERMTPIFSALILSIAVIMSLFGYALTKMLFRLYADCIERMIRYENIMNCYDINRFDMVDGLGALLPHTLMSLPVEPPASVKFFERLYYMLTTAYMAFVALQLIL